MSNTSLFARIVGRNHLDQTRECIRTALSEDGPDLTSRALFSPSEEAEARIVAKQDLILAGLPLAPLVLAELAPSRQWTFVPLAEDGDAVASGSMVAELSGSARVLLAAERIILNLLCHLSGVATLTRRYVDAMGPTSTRLLDTRKTLPGLRRLEKYAVRLGGGENHRMDLAEMLMLKDNHIDRAGSITGAVSALRSSYDPCPPIEVECRTLDEVRQAISCRVSRIMLDNMPIPVLKTALSLIPDEIESEISGGVSLETIDVLASLEATYISVGRLTHSAPAADLSMRIVPSQSGRSRPESPGVTEAS